MKNINLNTLLKLAAALGFLGLPFQAAAYPVSAPQPTIAEAAGNYGATLSGSSDMDPAVAMINGKNLQLRGFVRKDADCSPKSWFSKAPVLICPPAGVPSAAIKTQEALADAVIKENAAAQKPVALRAKRISRLREPGEAMGGGKARPLKEAAGLAEAKAGVERAAN